MLSDHEDIVRYITSKYSGAKKIVEVGIGDEDSVYTDLKKNPVFEVIAVDVLPKTHALRNNISAPDRDIYIGADLIYAIRPNPELLPDLQRLAEDVGASFLVRPLSTDSCHKPDSMKLINFGKAVLWEKTKS